MIASPLWELLVRFSLVQPLGRLFWRCSSPQGQPTGGSCSGVVFATGAAELLGLSSLLAAWRSAAQQ